MSHDERSGAIALRLLFSSATSITIVRVALGDESRALFRVRVARRCGGRVLDHPPLTALADLAKSTDHVRADAIDQREPVAAGARARVAARHDARRRGDRPARRSGCPSGRACVSDPRRCRTRVAAAQPIAVSGADRHRHRASRACRSGAYHVGREHRRRLRIRLHRISSLHHQRGKVVLRAASLRCLVGLPGLGWWWRRLIAIAALPARRCDGRCAHDPGPIRKPFAARHAIRGASGGRREQLTAE